MSCASSVDSAFYRSAGTPETAACPSVHPGTWIANRLRDATLIFNPAPDTGHKAVSRVASCRFGWFELRKRPVGRPLWPARLSADGQAMARFWASGRGQTILTHVHGGQHSPYRTRPNLSLPFLGTKATSPARIQGPERDAAPSRELRASKGKDSARGDEASSRRLLHND